MIITGMSLTLVGEFLSKYEEHAYLLLYLGGLLALLGSAWYLQTRVKLLLKNGKKKKKGK